MCSRIFHSRDVVTSILVLHRALHCSSFSTISRIPRLTFLHDQNYQTFAFELLVRNDVQGLEFQCPIIDGVCSCPFASTIQSASNCALAGNDILVVSSFPLFRRATADSRSDRIWTMLVSVMDCTSGSCSSSSSCIDWQCGECSLGGRNRLCNSTFVFPEKGSRRSDHSAR